jgi:hypothetical protein
MTLHRLGRVGRGRVGVGMMLAAGMLLGGVLPSLTLAEEQSATVPAEPQMSGDTRDVQELQGVQDAHSTQGTQGAMDTRSRTKPESAVKGQDENTGPAFHEPEVLQPEILQLTEPASPGNDLERAAQPGRVLPAPF